MKNIRLILLLTKKGAVISGCVIKLINDYREFLNIKGKTSVERTIIKLFMTHCDLDDKPLDPSKDTSLLDQANKLANDEGKTLAGLSDLSKMKLI